MGTFLSISIHKLRWAKLTALSLAVEKVRLLRSVVKYAYLQKIIVINIIVVTRILDDCLVRMKDLLALIDTRFSHNSLLIMPTFL